ncbi:anti-sigma regulatory factor [Oceanobacillus locisalsi]|uniref:Anti-sigma regulatory factor n=1 Tax=Oceanobacillus locisalsi TaxID=546107 RepID=A0ABW3NHD4_9BACI
MNPRSCVNIQKEWDIVGARQLGREMAKEIGFGNVDQARIATAVSELARNIYLYAENGQICFEHIYTNSQKGILMTAVDVGPGIQDVSRVMQDGYTTSGGLGAGLPGVKRLMDDFDIASTVGEGTQIKVIKWIR